MNSCSARSSLLEVLSTVLRREYLSAFRKQQELANPLVFFILVVIMFPLGVSPEPDFLSRSAAGVVWVAALLAMMLSMDRMFRNDFEEGALEQLVLSPQPLYLIVLIKTFVHWTLTGLPLVLLSPLLGTMMHLPAEHLPVLALTLLLGTPGLSLIGGIGAALTVSLRSGGVLITLIVLPLTIPILIFGTGTVQASMEGLEVNAYLAILGALLALSLSLAPLASAAALKMSVSS